MGKIVSAILIILMGHNVMSQKSQLIAVGVSANAYRGDLDTSLDKWSNVFHLGFKFIEIGT